MYYFKISVTRSMFKPFDNYGFEKVPKVKIDRIIMLDKIIINKGNKIVTRRRTVGFRATPRRNGGNTIASPRHTPPVPNLIPLKSALKMPTRPPFNVRGRKTMFATVNQSPIPSGSPIPRGTTAQMILNRLSPVSPVASTSGTVQTDAVTMPSPVGNISFGRLAFSDSEDSE